MLFPRSGSKRSEVAGLIDSLERQLAQHSVDLIHVDGVLRMFSPSAIDGDQSEAPDAGAFRSFRQHELAKDCVEDAPG